MIYVRSQIRRHDECRRFDSIPGGEPSRPNGRRVSRLGDKSQSMATATGIKSVRALQIET
jgi:hypothetical protein